MSRRLRALAVVVVACVATASPASALLCVSKKGGRVTSRPKCAKRETALSLAELLTQGPTGAPGQTGDRGDSGDKGDKGDQGDKGDTGAPGGFRVLDANAAEVGPVFAPVLFGTDAATLVFVQTPPGPLLLFVTPEGFLEQPLEKFYASTDCTGDAFVRHLGAGLFVKTGVANAGDVYYAGEPTDDRLFMSSTNDDGQTCDPMTETIRSGPITSFPVADLGFTAPFSLTRP